MSGVPILVRIQIPQVTEARIAATQLCASAEPAGYFVEVTCWGWGRRKDGSVEVDFRGRIQSPPDLVERLLIP